MIVEGTYTFTAPRQVVWDLLQDPEVLAKALPGARRLEKVDEDRFEGEMQVGVGPVSAAAFKMSVELSDKVVPEGFSMTVDSKGTIGFTRGTARVELAEHEDGTLMTYRADLKVGGKIAGVGQRVLDSASRTMTRQGLDALNREVLTRLGAPVPAAGRRGWWIAAALVVGGVILFLLLT